jgi:phospholipid/cholesterol/gamma-HCH transport system substrate-binding protein
MSKEAKLGLFVLIVFAVFLFFTINMGALFFSRGQKEFRLYFRNIGTLEPGAPVKQAGFDVGEVKRISLETIRMPTPVTEIVVEVFVSDEAIISTDSKASIQTLGMMGEKYIEISFGVGPAATHDTRIEGRGPLELEQVMEKALTLTDDVRDTILAFNQLIGDPLLQENISKLIANLEQFSEDLNLILGGEQETFKSIITNLAAASANLNSTLATAELFISDARDLLDNNKKTITDTFENISVVSSEIREHLVDDVKQMSGQLKEFSVHLNDSIRRANQLMAKIDGMVDESQPNVKSIMDNITQLTEKAKSASERVDTMLQHIEQENGLVHSLIYDPEMAEITKQTVKETSGLLNSVSGIPERIRFSAELRYFPDSPRFDRDDNSIRADMGLQFRISDELYIYAGGNSLGTANDLEAQIGYWFGPLSLHGGVIESEIGVGLDWQIFDRWLVGVEGIGLTHRNAERLDAYTEILLWNGISLIGGIQDLTDHQYANAGLKVHF